MAIILVTHQVPILQISILWLVSGLAAVLRALIVDPLRHDPNLTADTYLLLRLFDALVWTTFMVALPLIYHQQLFTVKNAVLWLGILPMMTVVMFVWELETLPPKLSREVSSMRYRNMLTFLCMVSVFITALAVIMGFFPLLHLLTAFLPLFAVLVIRVIWENWENFIWQIIRYVVIMAVLALVLAFLLYRFSPN